jgi:GntR family transcriptional repressor for pyruvate dehydrogenase complex
MDNRRLYQQIADRIRALTQTGPFHPGDRLPAERELAQQLGVSRPSLREALIALEIEGSVEIRMGSGVYVCARPDTPLTATRSLGESPSELMRARAMMEGAVVLLACARMTSDVLATLHETLDDMRAAIADGQKPLAQDRLFHMTIAAQAGNSVVTRLVGELFDERHSPLSAEISTRFENRDSWAAAVAEHAAVVEALEAGDALLAQATMHLHLQISNERWLAGAGASL